MNIFKNISKFYIDFIKSDLFGFLVGVMIGLIICKIIIIL